MRNFMHSFKQDGIWVAYISYIAPNGFEYGAFGEGETELEAIAALQENARKIK